jgi:hypothetical protein
MSRMRFDLDGIPLDDEDGRTTAFLRFRTTDGLILGLPESVDVTVPWGDLDAALVDLARGQIVVRLTAAGARRHPWLGAARQLTGRWTDREVLRAPPSGAAR